MPSKKKKYNARFPAGRIKKIMQSDEEIGKVAQAVPVIISRTLELFVESLLTKTLKITNSRNAKTLSTSHMKQCIMSEQRFDFLRELVKNIPDISVAEEAANYNDDDGQSSPEECYPDSDTPFDLSMPSTSTRANRTPIQTANGIGSAIPATHSQYKSPYVQGQNGNFGSDAEVKQRLRQRLTATATTTSVIMHTAAVAQTAANRSDYVQPLKLTRSESTPSNASQQRWQVATQQQPHTPQLHLHSLAQRQRLKHQSQSLPCHNNNNNSDSSIPAKRRKMEQPQTAIPAPVFSYDLCNKPVVKIDYSNLPLTSAAAASATVTTPTAALPLSAPPSTAAFNFSTAAPIINIDLSNIVTNVESNKPGVAAPVATISIGAISDANTSSSNDTLAAVAKVTAAYMPTQALPPNHASSDSKAKTVAPAKDTNSKTITAATTVMAATTTSKIPAAATNKNSNSFFELDEDYDNI